MCSSSSTTWSHPPVFSACRRSASSPMGTRPRRKHFWRRRRSRTPRSFPRNWGAAGTTSSRPKSTPNTATRPPPRLRPARNRAFPTNCKSCFGTDCYTHTDGRRRDDPFLPLLLHYRLPMAVHYVHALPPIRRLFAELSPARRPRPHTWRTCVSRGLSMCVTESASLRARVLENSYAGTCL